MVKKLKRVILSLPSTGFRHHELKGRAKTALIIWSKPAYLSGASKVLRGVRVSRI